MKTLVKLFTLLFITATLSIQTLGWSGPGHAAIAAAAYKELGSDSTQRQALVDLLQSHPAFPDWDKEFKQLHNLPAGLDFGMFLFIRASSWPDSIRGTTDPDLKKWDHPKWHFVNYPLRPPTFATGDSPFPDNDVLAGIKACRAILANKQADPVARAVYLSWLIHLVGDIHQPLHSVALIEGSFTPPTGDQGGNLFFVFKNQAQLVNHQQDPNKFPATKLHSFWDQQIGAALVPDPVKASNDADALMSEHPRSALSELSQGADIQAWSFESRDQAIESAYKFHGARIKQNVVLPNGYAGNANQVARRRLALAGYRLHDELGKVKF